MTRASSWQPAAAAALLVAAGVGAWWPALGEPILRVAPVAAVAVLVASRRAVPRLAGLALLVWVPVAVLLAGVPARGLGPRAWPESVDALHEGARRLVAQAAGATSGDPWALSAALVVAGALWVAGATLAASGTRSARRSVASFVVLASPWMSALVLRQFDQPPWQGAFVLISALLWFGPVQRASRPAIAMGLLIALVSVAAAQAAGPRGPWFDLHGVLGESRPQFRTLTPEHDYGPLNDRRRGAPMLEITADDAALWRMQVLDIFDGRGWSVGARTSLALPQPAAEPTTIGVRVRGLRNDMVVAPGRIRTASAAGRVQRTRGEAARVVPGPRRDASYRVSADRVPADAAALREAPDPTDQRLRAYTRLGEPGAFRLDMPLFGEPPVRSVDRTIGGTPYGPVLSLARRLAHGAESQWEVVERVERYLLDERRFRYTTEVSSSSGLPLVDFLLRERAGYCQHFAGAAALLLRLAGVPARVVSGFATGSPDGDRRFTVRDSDAHAWIEVYFTGHGWVPFNPTPAEADAEVAPRIDAVTGAATGRPARGSVLLPVILLAAAAAAAAGVLARRRQRQEAADLGELLVRLARRTGVPVGPSSTLNQLRDQLADVGPHSAALAGHAEQIRFAGVTGPITRSPVRLLARALIRDLGSVRALLLLARVVVRHRGDRGITHEAGPSHGRAA